MHRGLWNQVIQCVKCHSTEVRYIGYNGWQCCSCKATWEAKYAGEEPAKERAVYERRVSSVQTPHNVGGPSQRT